MHPDFLVGGAVLAAAMSGIRMVRKVELTPEQREEAERQRLEAIAIKRANSPAVAAAEAKRARKAAKLNRNTP